MICLVSRSADSHDRFIVCNEGFTVERAIHGKEAGYNDIVAWRWVDIPTVFGASDTQVRKCQVKTKDGLEKLLKDKDFNASKGLQVVELYMQKHDAPRALVLTAEASAKLNAKEE